MPTGDFDYNKIVEENNQLKKDKKDKEDNKAYSVLPDFNIGKIEQHLGMHTSGYLELVGQYVNIKKNNENVKLPTKATSGSAAHDLYADEDIVITPFDTVKVSTGFSIEIPQGYKGEIYSRSGLASKGVFVVNQPGKIDSDYRGEVFITLMYIPPTFYKNYYRLFQLLVNFAGDFKPGAPNHNNQGALTNLKDSLKSILPESYQIHAGDRIAQFEIQKVESIEFVAKNELNDTERGKGGFGHTGV